MCGIVGYTRNRIGFSLVPLENALDELAHRGPDEQGIYSTANVALGSVRLRVIDINGGEQPMISEDRDLVVVFNGEIYNHEELRGELTARGHHFRSRVIQR